MDLKWAKQLMVQYGLNKDKISSLDFFQFWRNVNDNDVSKFLYLFTKLPLKEIEKLSTLKNQRNK